ncbi:unnamed protein product [Choristocarpus tenellus]
MNVIEILSEGEQDSEEEENFQAAIRNSLATRQDQTDSISQGVLDPNTMPIVAPPNQDLALEQAIRNSLVDTKSGVSGEGYGTRSRHDQPRVKRRRTAGPPRNPLFRLNRLLGDHQEGTCVKLNDVLSGPFYSVLLCNFQVMYDWLLESVPRLRLEEVQVVLVHDGSQGMCDGMPSNVACHHPKTLQYGCHHTKMAVVKYATGIRVAVFTANFRESDWEGMVQGVWYQDFPAKEVDGGAKHSDQDGNEGRRRNLEGERRDASSIMGGASSNSSSSEKGKLNDFEDTLKDYFDALGGKVVRLFARTLSLYNFSAATAALVPSVPGYHTGRNLHKYGHMRVRALLENEAFPNSGDRDGISAQFSSLATVPEGFLDELTNSFMAQRGPSKPKVSCRDHLQLVWPTVEGVRTSLRGWSSGG